jgi:hypothetical protein
VPSGTMMHWGREDLPRRVINPFGAQPRSGAVMVFLFPMPTIHDERGRPLSGAAHRTEMKVECAP